jgi:hypothetical protein
MPGRKKVWPKKTECFLHLFHCMFVYFQTFKLPAHELELILSRPIPRLLKILAGNGKVINTRMSLLKYYLIKVVVLHKSGWVIAYLLKSSHTIIWISMAIIIIKDRGSQNSFQTSMCGDKKQCTLSKQLAEIDNLIVPAFTRTCVSGSCFEKQNIIIRLAWSMLKHCDVIKEFSTNLNKLKQCIHNICFDCI